MANHKSTTDIRKLVRTSVLVPEDVDKALRDLALEGKRPLSWEIRQALEAHVKSEKASAA